MSKSETSHTQKMLNVWAIILILWSFYRATFKSGLPIWFDEFIAKPFVFLIPIYWFITQIEKTPFIKGLGFSKKNIVKDVLFGFGIGMLIFGVAYFSRMIKGLPFPSIKLSFESIIWILSTIMAAAMEQVLSTGFVFKRLSEVSKKNLIRPLLTAALLFFFLHIPILFGAEKISGSILMQMLVLNTILSITTSLVFILRKNTVAPIIIHAFYLLSLPILL